MAKRGQTRNFRVKYRYEHSHDDPNSGPVTGTIVCDTDAAAEREARQIRNMLDRTGLPGSVTIVDVRENVR